MEGNKVGGRETSEKAVACIRMRDGSEGEEVD